MYKKPRMRQHLLIFAAPALWVMLADIFNITNGIALLFSLILLPVIVAVYISPAIVICVAYTALFGRRFSQAKKEEPADEQ